MCLPVYTDRKKILDEVKRIAAGSCGRGETGVAQTLLFHGVLCDSKERVEISQANPDHAEDWDGGYSNHGA
jgi:hypothetical protein